MRSVAERPVGAVLAAAQPDLCQLGDLHLDRCESPPLCEPSQNGWLPICRRRTTSRCRAEFAANGAFCAIVGSDIIPPYELPGSGSRPAPRVMESAVSRSPPLLQIKDLSPADARAGFASLSCGDCLCLPATPGAASHCCCAPSPTRPARGERGSTACRLRPSRPRNGAAAPACCRRKAAGGCRARSDHFHDGSRCPWTRSA